MKRYIVLLALCVITASQALAQDNTEKQYLPEKGDFSLGIDVAPMFKYVGNIFNGSTDNSLDKLSGEPITGDIEGFNIDDIAPDVSIMGKYMLTNNWAVRANIGLMLRKNTDHSYVKDDEAFLANPLSEEKLVDTRNTNRNGLSAMLGAEYHKGNRRVQGIFGAGVIVGFNQSKTNYKYANALTDINQRPSSAWETFNDNGYRTLQSKTASNVFFGLCGSVGVEWFVAPKVALGAEVDLALYYVMGGQEYIVAEGFNTAKNSVEVRNDINAPGSDAFRFGTDNLGGSLYLSFYF